MRGREGKRRYGREEIGEGKGPDPHHVGNKLTPLIITDCKANSLGQSSTRMGGSRRRVVT